MVWCRDQVASMAMGFPVVCFPWFRLVSGEPNVLRGEEVGSGAVVGGYSREGVGSGS